MKKLTFLMALLFGFAIKASADDYPLNFTNTTKSARLYSNIILNSKFYGEQTIDATIDNSSSTAKQYMYEDLTSQKFYCVAGEQLTASFTKGSAEPNFWLNGYIYIDDDKNGQFEYGVNSDDHKPTGDLYAYSFYTESTSSDEIGYNSAGQRISGDSRSTHNPPSFVAPTVPGVYRMRYKADWCSIEPGGDTNNTFGGTFTTYKGSIFDVTLVVVGYCNVSSAATDRNGKLHSDYNYINSKHSFLAADTESTNNFIWKIEPADATGLKFNLTSGQGFPLMLKDNSTPSLTFNTRTSTGAIYFTEAVNASKDLYADGDRKQTKKALTTWTGYPNAADNQWVFTKIDGIENEVGYVYSVNITKSVESLNISNARITKTATSELAFNGGFFYCTTAPTANDFTAIDVENATSNIVVDENAKTITVTYSEVQEYITDEDITAAQDLLALAGKVGYPSLRSDAYSTFNTFVSSLSTSTTTVAAYTAAVNAFKTATDIALPEDGKAYKIKCQAHEWSAYVKYGVVGTEGQITLVGSTTADTYETTFICHEISAGNYLFVDNAGRYLKWVCDRDERVYDPTGEHATTYNSTYNVLSLARASVNANNGLISNNVKNTDFFGRIEIKGTRANGITQSYLNMRHKTSDGENYKFISEAGLERYYDTDDERRSHTFIFEETEYPNLVNLTQATGIDDGTKMIATFSAPFAFTLPADIDAYYVVQTPQSNTAKMEALEYTGRDVAANTGVILYGSTSETQVRMIPAASNGTSAQSNMLGNSAGGPKQIVDVPGQTNYILAKKGGNVVFSRALANTNSGNKSISMNKAYLSILAGSSVNQFALSFGEDGPTTGIGSIEAGNAGSAAAPLYDLSGRRISQPATRGIYIRSGKKFMVK